MNTSRNSLRLVLFAAIVVGVVSPLMAFDGIVIAHPTVPASTLDGAALKNIYTAKTTYWEGGQAIIIVIAGDKTDAAIEQVSGMNATAFRTFWQRLMFSGRGQQPKKADDVAQAIALVAATKGAIAIVPGDSAPEGVKKIDSK